MYSGTGAFVELQERVTAAVPNAKHTAAEKTTGENFLESFNKYFMC